MFRRNVSSVVDVKMESIDRDTFITLAELACCNVIFSTHKGYFIQRDGLAMGSPPAPHLANGWLSTFDKDIQHDSVLYERYMDDSLCSVRKDEITERLAKINSLHPCLEFTYELEQEGKIPFLDMVIHNKSGKLTSSWYRKSTDTGLTLNYHALAPTKYKKSVVISFVHRIFRASSTWEYFHLGLEEAIGTLADNQYPSSFVMPIIRSTIEKLVCSDDNQMNDSVNASIDQMNESVNDSIDSNACLYNMDEKDKFMFFVTYRGKPTEQLAMSFRKLNAPCKIVMTTRKTKTVLPSLKPNVP